LTARYSQICLNFLINAIQKADTPIKHRMNPNVTSLYFLKKIKEKIEFQKILIHQHAKTL